MPRPKKNSFKDTKGVSSPNLFERFETEIQSNQSKVSLFLGALIVLVIGILVFNYFQRNKATLGPAQQTTVEQQQQDVTPDQLPGKYTVKSEDTLFNIAKKYYSDGSLFAEIAKANNLTDPDTIEEGQVLQIPKISLAQASPAPSASPSGFSLAETTAEDLQTLGTGGGNSTIWGPRIEGTTYTVAEDDWLSKIAGRAYGNIMAFDKIAKANNIENPDHIEPGMVLTIPR